MGLLSSLRDILVRIERNNNSIFNYPVEKQKKYLNHFNKPRDNFERSYYQYKCQMHFHKKIIVLGLNIVSLPLLLFFYFKKNVNVNQCDLKEAVFFSDGKPDNIIPNELRQKYSSWVTIHDKKERFQKEDKIFFHKLVRRYPFSWQFLLKCLIKIRFYSYAISVYNPRSIVVCCEYSFTSSVLTQYCEEKKIHHINVMHGEKLFYIRDSFFKFHTCYVWNDGYIDLFKMLRAENSQFEVAVPTSICFLNSSNIKKTVDYTYYLGAEEDTVLDNLMQTLDQLACDGNRVMLRPHPRYSDIKKIHEHKGKFIVEDYEDITIEDSLQRTKYAISGYSTVLIQAYHNGTKVVIDNLTQPMIYKKLVDLEYVMLKVEHVLLTDLLKNQCDD